MTRKSFLSIGFLSMAVATAALTGTESFAAYTKRVDVKGLRPHPEVQLDSAKLAASETTRVDVKDTAVKAEGPSFAYLKPMNR